MGGLKGRGARHGIAVPGGKALLIDESYNANPASMRATLAQLGQTPSGRRIAVLGSMKELGDFGPQFHAALAEPVLAADVDYALLVGDEMAALAQELGKPQSPVLGKPFARTACQERGFAVSPVPAPARPSRRRRARRSRHRPPARARPARHGTADRNRPVPSSTRARRSGVRRASAPVGRASRACWRDWRCSFRRSAAPCRRAPRCRAGRRDP